jgi:hypothetical protein
MPYLLRQMRPIYCLKHHIKEVKLSLNRPWTPIGLWDVETPTFSRQSAHRWRWGCQPYSPGALYIQEDSWYSFLLEVESTPRPMNSSGIELATFRLVA